MMRHQNAMGDCQGSWQQLSPTSGALVRVRSLAHQAFYILHSTFYINRAKATVQIFLCAHKTMDRRTGPSVQPPTQTAGRTVVQSRSGTKELGWQFVGYEIVRKCEILNKMMNLCECSACVKRAKISQAT